MLKNVRVYSTRPVQRCYTDRRRLTTRLRLQLVQRREERDSDLLLRMYDALYDLVRSI